MSRALYDILLGLLRARIRRGAGAADSIIYRLFDRALNVVSFPREEENRLILQRLSLSLSYFYSLLNKRSRPIPLPIVT